MWCFKISFNLGTADILCFERAFPFGEVPAFVRNHGFVFHPSTSSPQVRLTDIHIAPPKAKGQKMALGDFLQDKGMRSPT